MGQEEATMKATILIAASILVTSAPAGAEEFSTKFEKVKLKSEWRDENGVVAADTKGNVVVYRDRIQFTGEIGKGSFEIPTCSVTSIFYTRVSVHRLYEPIATAGGSVGGIIIGALTDASLPVKIATGVAGLIGSIFASSSRSHKHYMVLAFENGQRVGAVEFKLDKKNYRSCLRAIEQVTGETILYGQEGMAASEHKFPKRRPPDTSNGAADPEESGQYQ